MDRRSFQTGGALLLVLAALAAGCGDDEPLPVDDGGLAGLAPADAPLFVDVALRPSGEQREAINSLIGRLGVPNPGAALISSIDGLFAEDGLEIAYAADIEPWLGERGAVFVRSFEPAQRDSSVPDVAALFEVEDAAAAGAFLDHLAEQDPAPERDAQYRGAPYRRSGPLAYGLVDGAVVLGTEAAFRLAVDASEGESLAESEEYADRSAELGGDPVLSAFVEPATAIEAAIASNEISKADADIVRPLLAGPLSSPLTISFSATESAASLEIAANVAGEATAPPEADLLERLPAESWLALAAPELGASIERGLDQLETSGLPGAVSLRTLIMRETGLDLSRDVSAWLGDVSAFVAGTTPRSIQLGVIAATSDPAGPRAVLEAAQRLIRRASPRAPIGAPPAGSEYGFSIAIPGAPVSLEAGVIDDELVAAIGRSTAELLDPPERLGDDETYRVAAETLGEDLVPSLYLELPSFFTAAERGGASEDADYRAASPYLDKLGYLIGGSRIADGLSISRVTVGLTEG